MYLGLTQKTKRDKSLCPQRKPTQLQQRNCQRKQNQKPYRVVSAKIEKHKRSQELFYLGDFKRRNEPKDKDGLPSVSS